MRIGKHHGLGAAGIREHYGNAGISKWDIFHYVYAMLHHPLYREHFAQNLRNEIPRVPLARTFVSAARSAAS